MKRDMARRARFVKINMGFARIEVEREILVFLAAFALLLGVGGPIAFFLGN